MKYFCFLNKRRWFLFYLLTLSLLGCLNRSSLSKKKQIEIHELSTQITVKIWSTSPIGSGTIIKRKNKVYTIIAAAHLLRVDNPPYTIQTYDGKKYAAEIVSKPYLNGKDVVSMVFSSSQNQYQIAKIGNVDAASINRKVYAAGFPIDNLTQSSDRLSVREGVISLLLEKTLKNGYRLAYTSSIDLGMSGGPVINENGEVIGINGLRNDPIWAVPMNYEDGTEPSSQIQESISRKSMAIPFADIKYLFD